MRGQKKVYGLVPFALRRGAVFGVGSRWVCVGWGGFGVGLEWVWGGVAVRLEWVLSWLAVGLRGFVVGSRWVCVGLGWVWGGFGVGLGWVWSGFAWVCVGLRWVCMAFSKFSMDQKWLHKCRDFGGPRPMMCFWASVLECQEEKSLPGAGGSLPVGCSGAVN